MKFSLSNSQKNDRLSMGWVKRRGVVAILIFFLLVLIVLLKQAYISMPWDQESGLYIWRRPLAVGMLSASLFGVALGIGSLLWWMLSWISGAKWSTGIRRIWENIASSSTIAWLCCICVFCIMLNSIYPWAEILHKLTNGSTWVSNSPALQNTLAEKGHTLLAEKLWWLNEYGFILRALAVSALFIILTTTIRRASIKADYYEHALALRHHQSKMTFISGVALPAIILITAIIGIDWIMLINENWVSSIFPLYILAFAGSLALAATGLIAVVLRKWRAKARTGLEGGKLAVLLLVALSFKIYFGYSQYMIMDYASIPNEQIFMQQRMTGTWELWTQCLLWSGLILPLLLLCIPPLRRQGFPFALCCIICLMMGLAESYWLIAPSISNQTASDPYYLISFGGASLAIITMMLISLISLLTQNRVFARDKDNETYKHHS